MNCTSSSVLEGLCIPVCIFLSKTLLNWCSSWPKTSIFESYNRANEYRAVSFRNASFLGFRAWMLFIMRQFVLENNLLISLSIRSMIGWKKVVRNSSLSRSDSLWPSVAITQCSPCSELSIFCHFAAGRVASHCSEMFNTSSQTSKNNSWLK